MSAFETDDISGKEFDNRVVRRLAPYLRPYVILLAACSALVFLSAGVSLYTPKLLGHMVDRALVPKDMGALYRLGLLYIGLELLRLFSVFTQSFLLQRLGQNVMQRIRKDLYSRLLRMPVTFFDKHAVGKLVTRVTNDTVNLSELFSASFVMLLSDILLIIGVITAMILLHWKLGLIAVSVFPLMIMAIYFFSEKLRGAFRHAREVLARLNSFFAERMSGMAIVQLMERESRERKYYKNLSTEYRDRQFEGVYLYSLFHPTITLLSGISVVLVVWFGPPYIQNGEIPIGTFVSFLAYVQVLYQPVRNITDRYNIFLAAMSSAERIFTLMDMQEEQGLRVEELHESPRTSGALRFEQVHFSYETSKNPALSDVSFHVNAGETIAIVGPTGAGKTTVTSLLFRFYEPQSGQIFLGGRALQDYSKKELRERIGYVQQEVFLFSGTLRENLGLLRKNVADSEIMSACERTGFSAVIQKLPQGLDTLLDERGSNLSLGERQILAFTRVYLQSPDLLVLDEATSSVDRASELRIQKATRELVKNRAAIIIAHRLETVLHADRILVFRQGKIVESGNHKSLLQAGGMYARFVELQLSGGATGTQSTSSI